MSFTLHDNCLVSLRANLTGLMAVWCTKTTLITYTGNFTLEKNQVFQYCCKICQIKNPYEKQTLQKNVILVVQRAK